MPPAQLLKIVRSERESLPRDVDRSERDRYPKFQHRRSRRGIFEDVCIVNAMRPRRAKMRADDRATGRARDYRSMFDASFGCRRRNAARFVSGPSAT